MKLLVLLCVCTGCTNNSKLADDLLDYQQRLSNVLDAEPPLPAEQIVLSYPPAELLRYDIPQLNIKLREFFALQDCPVALLIGERNTALGKIQLPSARYVYEVELLDGLQDCIARQSDDQTKLQQLRQWLETKQQSLPLSWAAMITKSQEIQRFFASNQGFISDQDGDQIASTVQAVGYLVNLYHSPKADREAIEAHLKHLKQTHLASKMWRSQHLLTTGLTSTSQWLDTHFSSLTCETQLQKTQAQYLANVFHLIFVKKIQPAAGKLNDLQYKLTPYFMQLVANPHVHSSVTDMLTHHLTEFTHYQQAMSQHIRLWQGFLGKCNISVQTLTG